MGLVSDISAFYFGADFPFNIGLYDNFHYLWVTMQLVMDILLNIHVFTYIKDLVLIFRLRNYAYF